MRWLISYFYHKLILTFLCKLSPKQTICMKYQILFSGKIKKNIINVLSAQSVQRVVTVKACNDGVRVPTDSVLTYSNTG